ncbi:MAG: 2-amino-4-hydroxy-6-hydroxymethyldihydropteridine diphosphokinase [Desulfovibrionaceae bacterium]|nr:2-amino-4-hydroxy-6-hydroxymethyldihydropteridine diphosphokinase [Desulfovibrionaceae bacterium]
MAEPRSCKAPVRAYISLGSNLGDGPAHLAEARRWVAALPGVTVAAASSLYRTEPQGRKDQPWFVNQVLALDCGDPCADALLSALLGIEDAMGRVRDPVDRFGPRLIDLDVLLFGDEVRTEPRLTLPHPRLTERAFVLVPLREIAPDLMLPSGQCVQDLARAVPHRVQGDRIFQ